MGLCWSAMRRAAAVILLVMMSLLPAFGQAAPGASQPAPVTLTLKDALELAQKNDPQFLAALSDAAVAVEDVRQARASRYPTLSDRTEYLGTQGNGKTPDARFVTND